MEGRIASRCILSDQGEVADRSCWSCSSQKRGYLNVVSLRQADRADDCFPEGVQERHLKWICFSYKKMCLQDCEYGFEQFESRLDLSR